MKVVLFCGGRGVRIQREGFNVPKPLVRVGLRPILWHVMKYYAHYGHKDFILCLGYRADDIKRFFLEYDEWVTNDFTLANGGKEVVLARKDIEDWRITFVDTGLDANIGQRLRAVRDYVSGEEMFLANYSDGVTDLHLPDMDDHFTASGATASFLSVRPQQSFHVVQSAQHGGVLRLSPISESDIWINGGYFVFKPNIFEHIRDGEELVLEPFARLISRNELVAYRNQGFWASMDTFKDQQMLEVLHVEERAPWEIWKEGRRC
jgi:glucose-1-phosphate cytidylyltransferase